jgi:hypothetical protein
MITAKWTEQGKWEVATLEWAWWFNYHRLLGPTPSEYERAYYQSQKEPIKEVGLKENRLR